MKANEKEFNLSVFQRTRNILKKGEEKKEGISMIDEKAFSLLRLKQMFDSSRASRPNFFNDHIFNGNHFLPRPRKPTTTHKSSENRLLTIVMALD